MNSVLFVRYSVRNLFRPLIYLLVLGGPFSAPVLAEPTTEATWGSNPEHSLMIASVSELSGDPTPTPTPSPAGCLPIEPGCGNPGGGIGGGTGANFGVWIDRFLQLGDKVMNFVLTNKPNATYQTLKGSVVPKGIQDFSELAGWSKPVVKTYRVDFKNLFGKPAGGFSYRISFIYGGNYQGKGKYIGQIAFTPFDVTLQIDRQLDIKVELLDPINYGSVQDPMPGIQLRITWDSRTTPRYQMSSVEHFYYGNGDSQVLLR